MDKFILATGYEVELTEDYPEKLVLAIIVEMILNQVKHQICNWDEGTRMAINECERISIVYKLPLAPLFLKFSEVFVKVVGAEPDVNEN
jgi:hypothetical protein